MFGNIFEQPLEQPGEPSYSGTGFFVLSVGGSCIVGETIDVEFLKEFSSLVSRMHSSGKKLVLVAGGGSVARDYLDSAKELGGEKFFLDQIAIQATRLNASLLIHAIPESYPEVLAEISKADQALAMNKIPVFGGLLPGATTDYVAALLAEKFAATFVNLSDVDGIYTKDPKKSRKPKMFEMISHDKLLDIVKKDGREPGANTIIDLFAAMVLKRSNVPALFVNGKKLGELENALNGLDFAGTRLLTASP